MASFLQVHGHPLSFANPNTLEVSDIVAFFGSVVLLGGYHVYYAHVSSTHMHSSLSSHIDFSRISWAKYIYYDYKNKVTTIQNFRSALLILGSVIQAIATLVGYLFIGSTKSAWITWKWTSMRTAAPAILFMISFLHIMITVLAYRYLHFHTQIEDLSADEHQKFGIPVNETAAEQAKLSTAALAMQCNKHFRVCWRTLLVGLVFCLWSISPWLLLLGSCGTVALLYGNDFPFSGELQKMMEDKEQEVELEVKRVELLKLFSSLPN